MHTTLTEQPVQAAPTMPFGRHRGQSLRELPDTYLLWLACLDDLREPLLGQVHAEMDRRMGERLPEIDQPSSITTEGMHP